MPHRGRSNKVPPEIRDAVYLRADFKCERCGNWDKKLCKEHGRKIERKSHNCHHIQGPESIPENLCLLCDYCHAEWHSLERLGERDFQKWLRSPFLFLRLRSQEWNERGVKESLDSFMDVLRMNSCLFCRLQEVCVESGEE